MRPSLAKLDGINIDPVSAAQTSGIWLAIGSATLGSPYGYDEAIIRRNVINYIDQSSDTGDYSRAGIEVVDCDMAIIEDNVIRLPNTVYGSIPSQKSHIIVQHVLRLQSRNNRRPEDNSLILPWSPDQTKYLGDMEYEQHKNAVRSLMGW